MNVVEYLNLSEEQDDHLTVRPYLVLADGSSLSVQWSSYHMCSDTTCEVWGWSDEAYYGFWYQYAPDIDEPAGWVPFQIVDMYIAIKGGIENFIDV
jgi:hypothetical protein